MNFECKEVSIDNEEFGLGCTVTFSEMLESEIAQLSEDEIIKNDRNYLMLQRTYPEDEFEKDDSCYIETNFDDNSGFFQEFEIVLSRNKIVVTWEDGNYEVPFNINDKKFVELKKALQIITRHAGELVIHE
jgi:hypothetical protein